MAALRPLLPLLLLAWRCAGEDVEREHLGDRPAALPGQRGQPGSGAQLRPLLPLLLLAWRCAGEDVEVLCADSACYTLHRSESTWGIAQQRCQDNGGNLAPARSAAEATRLRQLLAAARWAGPAWLGLTLPRGHCVQPQEPLRGFSWVAGGEQGNFSAWASEPADTCVSARCASLRPDGGWSDRPCRSALPAFLCKFSFRGMCGMLPLAGGGSASFSTPFGVRTARLAAAPFGTLAEVRCRSGGRSLFAVCKGVLDAGGFAWHPPGPLCPVDCGDLNGGCQQRCLEAPGESPRCACHPGFVLAALAADMASCLPEDSCHPNPCQGSCRPLPAGFECGCEPGFALAADGRGCADVDECESGPCEQRCRNTPGSFQCLCRPGGAPAGPAGRLCHDVDECAQPHACPQLCINIPGSFRCACRPGFQRQPGGDSCLDVDECLRDLCPGACRNFPGGYECLCPPGSTRDGDGHGCSPGEAILNSTPQSSSIPESSGIIPQSSGIIPQSSSIIPQSSSITPQSSIPGIPRIPRTTSIPRTPGMPTAGLGGGSDEHSADGPRLLLYYIVGSLVAILLLLAFALALVACRRRAAKREKPPAKSAADNYCWVPEQPESRGERR
ncbi:PREDICTED: complement component C1q receptor [Ficedula albicollis]|uniref:complement component C1q receptor n=1 Tax=Ficedula albicollis TaxID=59894 RepID=UPI00035A122E|nr:PREDICTED: complement component C1q receptor [Ficedula albicollis]